MWTPDAIPYSPSAALTEIADPLPDIPHNELHNAAALSTLNSHPHLFKIVTPIEVDRFELLLKHHPNKPLVSSVCKGLREGFWPFAKFDQSAPETWDNSSRVINNDNLEFALRQRDDEISAERFSTAFGPDLLPGMYSMPIGVVPKPHSTDFRLVTDHSAGEFALNNYIMKADASIRLDNLQYFGTALRAVVAHNGQAPPGFSNLTCLLLIGESLCICYGS